MTARQHYHTLLSKKLISEFEKRGIEGYYCETKESALEKALGLIPKEATVSCGGSLTASEIGLIDALTKQGYRFLNINLVKDHDEMDRTAREALAADYFLMSANAITEQGELVNTDAIGNRTCALIFGPQNVVVIAGMNKVMPSLDAAILRVKNHAARMMQLKFNPNFSDMDALCEAAQSVASQLVITSKSAVKGRIKVILVGDSLGF